MRTRAAQNLRRDAFTLIELLIVIGIIAVLASLTAAAAMKVLYKPAEVRARSEISQLDGGVQSFLTSYQVDYVPSQLKLCRKYGSYNLATQLDNDSVNFILKTIGRSSPTFKTYWTNTGINWTTDSKGTAAPATEVLEGHQVLVFLLGGLQVQSANGTYNCIGFSDDVSKPDRQDGTRIGPFYTFLPVRLSVPTTPAGLHYLAYQDAYGARTKSGPTPTALNTTPFYAFYSSYGKTNGYNRYGMSDCSSLPIQGGTGPWPYATGPTVAGGVPQYVNPTSWQIICAGMDGYFGQGTSATSPQYWNGTPLTGAAADDQANFASSKLGFGQ